MAGWDMVMSKVWGQGLQGHNEWEKFRMCLLQKKQ